MHVWTLEEAEQRHSKFDELADEMQQKPLDLGFNSPPLE